MDNEEESVVGALPPPRKSDVLFGSGTDWQANACVNTIDPAMAYQDGYRRAALRLAEFVCEAGQGQDFLVYPIVYLYRHHIELTLKSIINAAAFVIDYTLTEKDLDTLGRHDLAKLWNLAKPMLNPACGLGGSPALPPDDLEGSRFLHRSASPARPGRAAVSLFDDQGERTEGKKALFPARQFETYQYSQFRGRDGKAVRLSRRA